MHEILKNTVMCITIILYKNTLQVFPVSTFHFITHVITAENVY